MYGVSLSCYLIIGLGISLIKIDSIVPDMLRRTYLLSLIFIGVPLKRGTNDTATVLAYRKRSSAASSTNTNVRLEAGAVGRELTVSGWG